MSTAVSVFGATGFVGSAFLKHTQQSCIPVPREDRLPPTNNILYLISTVDNYNVFTDLYKDIDTNLKVLMEVLTNCQSLGPNTVINFISSWFVYGMGQSLPIAETAVCDPRGFYSITKRAAEQLLVSWCTTFGVNYRILRLGNIYGPGDQKASKKKNAIGFMVNEVQNHRSVTLYEDGDIVRDMLHVEDTVRAMDLVMSKGELNTIYNIGSGQPTKLRDIITIAAKLSNSRGTISSIPTPAFHQQVQARDVWLDTTKLQKLGFVPQISLEEGIITLLTPT
jgi:nucleoside-diphosphate-sugar epimerase